MRTTAQQKYRRMIRELLADGYCDLVCLVEFVKGLEVQLRVRIGLG